jgi:DNA-binding MurR/RpiR family transcriptional regulator
MAEVKVSQEGKEITDAAKDKFELHSKVAKYALDIYEASEKVSVEEQAEALGVSEKVHKLN